MVNRANDVADKLAAEGISVEVVDPRTVSPLDEDGILESVASTGRVVIVDESAAPLRLRARRSRADRHQGIQLPESADRTDHAAAHAGSRSPRPSKLPGCLTRPRIEESVSQAGESLIMADIKAIDIPKWGLSMEEGLVNAWPHRGR